LVKVVVNNGQYKITIPKDLAEAKGWTSRTKLRFVEDAEGNVFLKEMPGERKAGRGGGRK
jgi:bifunctional DNA-binding transcriptional regulator/antitoxin component of YhaV-PrlF toxin-antitoxin module